MEQSEYGKKGQVLHESYILSTVQYGIRENPIGEGCGRTGKPLGANDHVSVLKIQHWRSIQYLSNL